MTKKLNPMLESNNRVKLLMSGMDNIDILQRKTIEEAKKNIKNYEDFTKNVHQQFEKSFREYRKMLKPLQEQASEYTKQQQQMVEMYESEIKPIVEQVEKERKEYKKLFKIDEATKKMIDDAVEVSQSIEGYSRVASQHLQEEVARIMKRYNVKISTQKE